MATPPHIDADDDLLVRYLLGELPDDERERLQDAYFTDDVLFARLLVAEDDLIDAYARGTLTEAQRRRFEQRFGPSPVQARRLKFARLLQDAARVPSPKAAASPPRRIPAWMAVAAAVLLLAVLGAGFWAARRPKAPERVATAPTAIAPTEISRTPTAPALPSATERAPTRRPPLAVASLLLGAGTTRSGGAAAEVTLAPDTRGVDVRLEIGADVATESARYEIVIQAAAGAEVFRRGGLQVTGGTAPSLQVRVPTDALTQRDYVVLLSAEALDGTRQYLRGYSFKVLRKD
jgi:hypothetical protein